MQQVHGRDGVRKLYTEHSLALGGVSVQATVHTAHNDRFVEPDM